ncbi:probable replication factor C subunit 1 [Amphibalanus amphitrite]|uniref:probable replication factor C subunit 1 n=1 Tax=Amphibalanus amphitrite TaxID=1232801 RepID=UPI001C912C14|nr:probable replication factor C subunit 1 [Amphibalanus amphitrite]XP_043196966.1 probable replication factor C subunit 1 [Amphibalanus amphitrite]
MDSSGIQSPQCSSTMKPSSTKCVGGSLLQFFQKKVELPQSHTAETERSEKPETLGNSPSEGQEKVNGTVSSKEQDAHKRKGHAERRRHSNETRAQNSSSASEKTELKNIKSKKSINNGANDEPRKPKPSDHEEDLKDKSASRLSSQNPFQILMQSGKKKGVWDKPTAKAKEAEAMLSDDECVELCKEEKDEKRTLPGKGEAKPENVKYFSIFSPKARKNQVQTGLDSDANSDTPDKSDKVDKTSKKSGAQNLAKEKQKSSKSSQRSSIAGKESSKRKKSSEISEDNTNKVKSKKSRGSKTSVEHSERSSEIARKRKGIESESVTKVTPHSTPKKSRLKVASDSDFEPEDVNSGKRKGRTPSKSQSGSSKRPRTDSAARTDAKSPTKPATLSAAQKLVKKSREQAKRRSGDASSRRQSASSTKAGAKQTLLTVGRKPDEASSAVSATASPRRQSSRAEKKKSRAAPSDSEIEFTPGRKSSSRRSDANADTTPRHTSGRKRSRTGRNRPTETSGSELEATPVKKPTKRTSTGTRRRLSSTDIEVLPTAAEADGPRRSPERRRPSRPRRPVVLSDSEVESSPAKRPARRSRAAPPSTAADGESPAPRRSSRPSRPVRRLSDSEVEVSPMKKPARGKRSAATDDPEVVLVRSRSAGQPSAGARPARGGVDAFQMLRRGGRPPKETAAEKAANEARRAFLASGVPERLQVQAEVAKRLEESLTPMFPEVSHVLQRVDDQPAAPSASPPPLPPGLSWVTEPPPPPPLAASLTTPVGGLVPGLAALLGRKPEVAADVGAGGDASGETASIADPSTEDVTKTAAAEAVDPGEPADSSSPPACLPRLSQPECAASLRQLLDALSESSTPVPSGTTSSSTTSSGAASTTPSAGPSLWTDRFRPRHHDAFAGACLPAGELHEWLAEWRAPSSGVDWEDDGSEEPASDGTVLLLGPTGCGKTSAVYAAAAQLGFQVLEVSASNRRSGRHLSSQLSEATQSQRVSLLGGGGGGTTADPPSRSLLLLEDVQLVSEELDDGFLAAAASLAAAAKRPVVLTSDDPAVTRTRLLRALPHRLLTATAPAAAELRVRLVLVALSQGWLLPERVAARLAGTGDARRALLQLQWLCEGQPDGAETVDTWQALTEAQLEPMEEFVDRLPPTLKVVRLTDSESEPEDTAAGLPTVPAGRRQSGWTMPTPEVAAGYDGQTRRRWRCVDPDLFSDEDEARPPAPSPAPAPAAEATPAQSEEETPPEDRALLAESVAALSDLYDVRSECDALVAPTDRLGSGSWWRRRPQADMAESEQPRCVTEERCDQLGQQLAAEALGAAGRRCADRLRTARDRFASSGRPEPEGLRLPLYEEEEVRQIAWEHHSRLAPAVPSLLLSRRAAAADLLPSIRRICRLECHRRATDGGRTRRFLHYFDQMGLHAVPSGLRTHVCESLM